MGTDERTDTTKIVITSVTLTVRLLVNMCFVLLDCETRVKVGRMDQYGASNRKYVNNDG